MLPAEIIRKKRDGFDLSANEIQTFIGGYAAGDIPDYQAAALLMAIFFQGMTPEETATLTHVMMNSGHVYTWTSDRPLIDKHSTGGVGDKVSLVLAPLAAACGLAIPMVCGRGLGHTGGTLDKLESIPGFQINLPPDQFINQVNTLGVAIIGQSDQFVPADKKMYALRDVTGTVECIPLLCSSILSKKAASGARGVVMDVKCGNGAFMPDLDGARTLAKALVATGSALDLPLTCLITNMDQPLGRAVGNANEILESVACLKGGGPPDLREITLKLTSEMLILGKLESDIDSAYKTVTAALHNGSALEIFRQVIIAQGGDCRFIDHPENFHTDIMTTELLAEKDGYLTISNCRAIGLAALALGAGRRKSSDTIDPAVGLTMEARAGDFVTRGQPIVTISHRAETELTECRSFLQSALNVTENNPALAPLILDRIV